MPCATIRVREEKSVLVFGDIVAPSKVSAGEEFDVKCTVNLKSGKSGTYSISLYVNSNNKAVTLVKDTVTLSVGETKIVKFRMKMDVEGDANIAVAPSGFDLKDWSNVCEHEFVVG